MKTIGELRKAEQEVDNYYKSNPLLNLPFATAAWALLAFAEESMLKAHSDGAGTQYHALIADNLINDLNAPMCWLYNSCKKKEAKLHLLGMKMFSNHLGIYSIWDKNIDRL